MKQILQNAERERLQRVETPNHCTSGLSLSLFFFLSSLLVNLETMHQASRQYKGLNAL